MDGYFSNNLFSYLTLASTLMNAVISYYLSYRMFFYRKKDYLRKQFGIFFLLFGTYFIIINLVVIFLQQNLYLFFVVLETAHFLLVLSLAFLFSAFVNLKNEKETKTAFWAFVIAGAIISFYGLLNINPEISSLNDSAIYFDKYGTFIPKAIILSFGFLYPAYYFFREGLKTKEIVAKKRLYLFSASFVSWLIGGVLHSQFQNTFWLFAGDSILLIGFIFAGLILLEKE